MPAPTRDRLDIDILRDRLSVVTRASLSAADFIVVVVTIVATWNRGLPRLCTTESWRLSLGDVLLYNGAHLSLGRDVAYTADQAPCLGITYFL